MKYKEFCNILNDKIFGEDYVKLLACIAEHSERFIGKFRPSSPKIKLIQNITQSREIKFGDALEQVFSKYFDSIGLDIMERNISDGVDELDIDQLLKNENEKKIYLIEQKVRDDHDSTKKKGQFDNFEKKYKAVKSQHGNIYTIIPVMWFIDPELDKNRSYYEKRIVKMIQGNPGCTPYLLYGNQLSQIIPTFNEIRNEVDKYLIKRKATIPDEINLDFDQEYNKIFDRIKYMIETRNSKNGKRLFSPNNFKKILENNEIKNDILTIIFTNGDLLKKIRDYLKNTKGVGFKKNSILITEYLISRNFEEPETVIN